MERKRLPQEKPAFRITHPDQHNWDLEVFRKGGETITQGPFSGKLSKEKWTCLGHYTTLRHAVMGWLHEEAARGLQESQGDAKAILEALDAAEKRVLAGAIQSIAPEVAPKALEK